MDKNKKKYIISSINNVKNRKCGIGKNIDDYCCTLISVLTYKLKMFLSSPNKYGIQV
jgi:hypothetical protein